MKKTIINGMSAVGILFLFFIPSILANDELTTQNVNKVVCCYEYGYGSQMAKVNERISWKENESCAVKEGFVGGNKEIVENRLCEAETINVKNVTGLPNAILRVNKPEVAQHLAEVLQKITDKRVFRDMKNTTFREENNKIIVEGTKEGKFLGFIKMNRKHRYVVSEDGTFIRQKRLQDIFFTNDK